MGQTNRRKKTHKHFKNDKQHSFEQTKKKQFENFQTETNRFKIFFFTVEIEKFIFHFKGKKEPAESAENPKTFFKLNEKKQNKTKKNSIA